MFANLPWVGVTDSFNHNGEPIQRASARCPGHMYRSHRGGAYVEAVVGDFHRLIKLPSFKECAPLSQLSESECCASTSGVLAANDSVVQSPFSGSEP